MLLLFQPNLQIPGPAPIIVIDPVVIDAGIGGAGFEMRSTWHKPKGWPARGKHKAKKQPARRYRTVEPTEPERLRFDPSSETLLQVVMGGLRSMRAMPAYSFGASDSDMQMAEAQLRANAQQRMHKDRVEHKQDDEDAILALLLH